MHHAFVTAVKTFVMGRGFQSKTKKLEMRRHRRAPRTGKPPRDRDHPWMPTLDEERAVKEDSPTFEDNAAHAAGAPPSPPFTPSPRFSRFAVASFLPSPSLRPSSFSASPMFLNFNTPYFARCSCRRRLRHPVGPPLGRWLWFGNQQGFAPGQHAAGVHPQRQARRCSTACMVGLRPQSTGCMVGLRPQLKLQLQLQLQHREQLDLGSASATISDLI